MLSPNRISNYYEEKLSQMEINEHNAYHSFANSTFQAFNNHGHFLVSSHGA